MSNLVIVAIPDENDRVWKVSSEKVPHLTLLFLGDVEEVANLDMITQFVEHAATTTLNRFYLPVDRRGELGNDPETGPADVLFFKKGRYDFKAVWDFRSALLKDANIKTAYDAAPQFDGPWTPHLTLGYAGSPANEMPDGQDYPFYDVSFNTIGVWLGNYDGPSFLLKDFWDDFDAMATVPMDVAMSDLRHHGVKGMRWGVRKEDVGGAAKNVGKVASGTAGAVGKAARATSRFVKDVQFENKVEDGRARQEVISKATPVFKKQDLPALKAAHAESGGSKLKTRVLKPASKEARAYRKDAREAYIKRLEESANATKNASGDRQYTIRERGVELPAEGGALPKSKHYWDVSSRAVVHAGEDDFTTLELIMDDDGWITDLQPVASDDTLAQSMAESGETFVLEHFGVQGMKWGHRKPPPTAVAPVAISHVPHGNKTKTKVKVEGGENHPAHEDAIRKAQAQAKLKKSGAAALSNKELKDLANRIELEDRVQTLTTKKGRRFVQRQIGQQGQQQLQKGLGRGIAKGAARAGAAGALFV